MVEGFGENKVTVNVYNENGETVDTYQLSYFSLHVISLNEALIIAKMYKQLKKDNDDTY